MRKFAQIKRKLTSQNIWGKARFLGQKYNETTNFARLTFRTNQLQSDAQQSRSRTFEAIITKRVFHEQ